MTIEDKLLIADVSTIITALISGELTEEEHAALRAKAVLLRARLSQRMRAFAAEHGAHVACPLNRAEYLLSECLEHATLLGPQ